MEFEFLLDSLDGLDAAYHGMYKKNKAGKFELQVKGMPKQEDTKGLKKALETERENARAAAAEVRAWEKLGLTPDEITAIQKEADDAETELAKKNGDFDALMAQAKKKWDKERDELVAERDAAQSNEREAVIENQLMGSLSQAGFNEEGLSLLPNMLAPRVKIETIDGKRVTTILTKDGSAPMVGDGDGGRATFAELAKEASVAYPSLMNSQRRGGGGKPSEAGGSGSGKQMLRTEWNDLHPSEQQAVIADGTTLVD